MTRLRRQVGTIATALLTLPLCSTTATARPAQAPAPGPSCNTSLEPRQPVLLVHGFNSRARAWDASKSSLANSTTCVTTFDYEPGSTDWVTNPAIGKALGAEIRRLAFGSRKAGGTGKVIVVAHSMGGLATRCAVSSQCGGGDPDDLRELITFGTPNHGTYLKSYTASYLSDVVGPYLSYSGGCYGSDDAKIPGFCKEIQALGTSAAGKAFTPGSAQLNALPDLPDNVPDFAIAGSFLLTTSLFLHTFTIGDLGDLVVARESALSAARPVDGTGGQGSLVPCGSMDVAMHAFAFHCWHGTETHYSGFVDQAQAEIAKIERADKPHLVQSATAAARKALYRDAVISRLRAGNGFAFATVTSRSAGGQAASGFLAVFKINVDGSMVVLGSGSVIDPIRLLDLGVPLAAQAKLNGQGIATTRTNLAASCGDEGYTGGDAPSFDGFSASFPPDGTELDAATLEGLEGPLTALISKTNSGAGSDDKTICVEAIFKAGLRYAAGSNTFAMKVAFITGAGVVSTHALRFSIGSGRRSYTLDGRHLQ